MTSNKEPVLDKETSENQDEILKDLSSKMNEFIAHSVEMFNRLGELEVAVAYLLSKDPEWVENFHKSQEKAGEEGEKDGQEKTEFVEPE